MGRAKLDILHYIVTRQPPTNLDNLARVDYLVHRKGCNTQNQLRVQRDKTVDSILRTITQ